MAVCPNTSEIQQAHGRVTTSSARIEPTSCSRSITQYMVHRPASWLFSGWASNESGISSCWGQKTSKFSVRYSVRLLQKILRFGKTLPSLRVRRSSAFRNLRDFEGSFKDCGQSDCGIISDNGDIAEPAWWGGLAHFQTCGFLEAHEIIIISFVYGRHRRACVMRGSSAFRNLRVSRAP